MIHGPNATDALIVSQARELVREATRLLKDSDALVRAQRARDALARSARAETGWMQSSGADLSRE